MRMGACHHNDYKFKDLGIVKPEQSVDGASLRIPRMLSTRSTGS